MFQMRDTDTGLSLSLSADPKPRNPRLAENTLFQIVTWTRGLGDPHDWLSPAAFQAAITPGNAAIFPLKSIATSRGPILVQLEPGGSPLVGFAFATFERLCIEFGLEKITPDIRAHTLEEAEVICLSELQDYEHFVEGDVHRFTITDRRGEVLETRRDLYGDGYARHVAQEAFEQHLMSVHADG